MGKVTSPAEDAPLIEATKAYLVAVTSLCRSTYPEFDAQGDDWKRAVLTATAVQFLLRPQSFGLVSFDLDDAVSAIGLGVGSQTGHLPEVAIGQMLNRFVAAFADGRREAISSLFSFPTAGNA